ncbi:MAG: phosphoglycerate dehydrogenase [Methanosarcinales archaeon]|nr:MAG: phosphoglycerate dehydrogenase [Methanosarcinales archaeon]
MKILVSDPLAEDGLQILRSEHEVDVLTGLAPQELADIIAEYDALAIRSGTKVTEEIIEAADRLKIIGRAGVGVDNIDIAAATRKGIIVANTPEGNTISAAEHTIAMMFAMTRNIPQANASMKANEWNRKQFMGSEIREKVLGVVGLGRVGIEVAKRVQGMEMKIIAYDPFIPAQRAKELGIELTDLDTVLKKADYITVHTPLTSETKDLIDDAKFGIMKPGVRIVNCARGGIINEDALARAVSDGKVAGAALDVFVNEPPTGSPLLALDQVIVTPHLGASTAEAQVAVAVDVAKQILTALRGESVKSAINLPSIRPDVMSVVSPYISIAETLGGICTQLAGSFDAIEIGYAGEIFDDVRMITLAALKGVLAPSMGPTVNYVNAPEIAKGRKIKVKESKSAEAEETPAITISLTGSSGTRSVTGTLIGDHIRILEVDGCHVDITPSKYLIVSRHRNQPNIIGPCCMILGREQINISGMQVSEAGADDASIMILDVDSEVSDTLLGDIRAVDGVLDAELIRL